MTTAFITHADCAKHDMGAHHPECPARLAAIEYKALPAILSIEDALAQQAFVMPTVTVERGGWQEALAASPHRLTAPELVAPGDAAVVQDVRRGHRPEAQPFGRPAIL